MHVLIIIGAAHALYLSVLILMKRGKQAADYWLLLFMILLSLIFLLVYLSFEYELTYLQVPLIDINLLLAPLFFLYISALIERQPRFPRILLHFIPYLLCTLYMLQVLGGMSDAEVTELMRQPYLRQSAWLYLVLTLELLALPIYTLWALRLLHRHRQAIVQIYSYSEGVDLRWVYRLMWALGGIWTFTSLPFYAFRNFYEYNIDRSLMYGFSLSTLLIFYLGYFGVRQTSVFTNLAEEGTIKAGEETGRRKYRKSSLETATAQEHVRKLLAHMAANKPYLESKLSIYRLAKQLNISTHHLSQVINSRLGESFYDFVNRYRVEEFKILALQPENQYYTLLSIALDCGFNSKASFNRIFKKHAGLTPSEFLDHEAQARKLLA